MDLGYGGGHLGALRSSVGFWKEGWRKSCSFGSVTAWLPAELKKLLGDAFLFLCV